MDKTAIYHKSARGAEAIALRNGALSPKLRSMLILINGRRPFAELVQLGQGLGDPVDLMLQLEAEGFIEPGERLAGPPTAPAPLFGSSLPAPLDAVSAPAPLGGTRQAMPLAEAQKFAVRRLSDLLGPTGDDLCMRIEKARDTQEFRLAIRRTATILREVVGPELATQFVRDVDAEHVA